MERKVIGVDFGSTQCSIAFMNIGDDGYPELMNVGSGRGGASIPTLLALDENDESVVAFGNEVKNHYRRDNTQNGLLFASNFKRLLGQAIDEDTSSEKKREIRDAQTYCRLFIKQLAEAVKKYLNLEELSSKDFATCFAYPATWGPDRVNLLKKYAEEAGFPADTERGPGNGIYAIPEPVAAMYALKCQEDSGFRFGDKIEKYMVIDFGGGTLDICVIKTDILGRSPEILSTSGDAHLGGKEFDDIISDLFFRQNENISKSDLKSHEMAELNEKFKEAKEAVSENFQKNSNITIPFHIGRGQYSLEVNRTEFKNICKDKGIFNSICDSIRTALKNAGIDRTNIKRVILTGGSSKMFFMREIVAKEFSLGGDNIFLTDNPFTDVANGCALSLARSESGSDKKGIWIQFRLDPRDRWSDPKCILKPGRHGKNYEQEKVYIGSIRKTKYFFPRKIYIQWLSGDDENSLTISGGAIISVYTRSNMPFMDTFRGVWAVMKKKAYEPVEDVYKIFLQYHETKAGPPQFEYWIMDHEASQEIQNSKENPHAISGKKGAIIEGYVSSRSWFGFGGCSQRALNEQEKKSFSKEGK